MFDYHRTGMTEARSQLRWRLSDEPSAQSPLFEGLVRREVGKGEYRGLEFFEVESKKIINRVPGAPYGFEYSINAYRGCSHACSYCQWGDTPVLMGDGSSKRLAAIRSGDLVYGTFRRGRYRHYTVVRVLDHWESVRRAYRIRLNSGTSLIASGNHRFLTNRGWKHVTGAEQGARRRPHLTLNNSLEGMGPFHEPPKADEEYRRGYLAGMIRGDGHLGVYRQTGRGPNDFSYHFRLALADLEALDRSQQYLEIEGIDTRRFQFAEGTSRRRAMEAIRTQKRSNYTRITTLIAWPSEPSESWTRGFLAGVFDAEGSGGGRETYRISNRNEELVEWIVASLQRLGFDPAVDRLGGEPRSVRFRGGLSERVRFVQMVDPAIGRKRSLEGAAVKTQVDLGVADITDLGIDIPMYDITTESGDFIANGVVSHNCFARPTHEYLGLDAGKDFETKIVVKVNSAELVRAETAPGRWGGELIAMGTNTDPYQPAEGRYKLTRGIVEVLAERRNPFSVLTKSTLVLRDLDLFADAVRAAEVRVDLSIGTLDEDVWKATEPGTPHPRRRVEAVARLNKAGIPSGVLVAPVLPGLSDRPEQLAAVVRAAVDAGAVGIHPVLLHIRPGVREQYLGWLQKARPDLVGLHENSYSASGYAPQAWRKRLSRQVRELVEQYGGPTSPPRPSPSPPGPETARQLQLL